MGKTVIFGATGRIGSALVTTLINKGIMPTAVVRDKKKISVLPVGTEVAVADIFHADSVVEICHNADTMFILTPENPFSNDVIGDGRMMIENYLHAAQENKVSRIIALSSMGAQLPAGTGNLVISYLLEKAFTGYSGDVTCIRPNYYFSNWDMYLDTAKTEGILPTFFPSDLSLQMISPVDVAHYIADVMINGNENSVVELSGPVDYSSNDVAEVFSKYLGREVTSIEIPVEQCEASLLKAGFTPDGAKNFALMTAAVVKGISGPEFPDKVINLETDFYTYLSDKNKG